MSLGFLEDKFSREALAPELNQPQLEAVVYPAAPLLIVAGAGSGKTRVITYRLARMLSQGARPHRILSVTFTNKAAGELRERSGALLGGIENVRGLWLGTFHSLSARLLRQYGEAIGVRKDFVIYDMDDQRRLLARTMSELKVSEKQFPVRQVQWAIDQAKNKGIEPADYDTGDYFDDMVGRLYAAYEQRLSKANAVDFGGLLVKALKLCTADSPAALELANRFDHVLVDEFQDTNIVQYKMVRFLSRVGQSITVVGDEDQSIYRWRGADIRNILDFERDHPDCQVVKLEQNYRSTGHVLRLANAIISRNRERRPKTLFTRAGDGDLITYFEGETERDEADFVVGQIDDSLRREGTVPRDFAVFYRTNAQSRVIEEALRVRDIPYVVVGGTRFYDRAEIKDLLAYLRVLQNPADDVGLLRIINTPARGIGSTTVQKIAAVAQEEDLSLWQSLARCVREPQHLGNGPRKKLQAFWDLMEALRMASPTLTPAALAEKILEDSGYRDALAAEASIEAEGRIENLLELVAQMREYEVEEEEPSLAGFLERVALVSDVDGYDPSQGAVSLMTVHTAKGLEFPCVFVTGLEDGVFPHQRSIDDDQQLEEERRLCYVAVTRAMKRLFLTRVRRRRLSGQVLGGLASRFLRDIPEECVHPIVQARPAYLDLDAGGQGPWRGGGWSRPGGGAQARRAAPESGPSSGRAGPRSFVPDEAPAFAHDDSHSEMGLRVGAQLRHAKFGVGVVRGWQSTGPDLRVTLRFASVGVKTILARFLEQPG